MILWAQGKAGIGVFESEEDFVKAMSGIAR